MSRWLLSVVGVVFLGVLFDVIYPNGKTNTFCRGLFAIFTIYVLISPLLNININVNYFDNYIDSSVVENINTSKNEALVIRLKEELQRIGIDNVFVEIECDMTNSEYSIESICIDITNSVLDKKYENINIYEVITDKIISMTGIDAERVMFYG